MNVCIGQFKLSCFIFFLCISMICKWTKQWKTTSDSLWGQAPPVLFQFPNQPGVLPLARTGSGWKWASRQDVARESAARSTIKLWVLTQTAAPVLPLRSTRRRSDWSLPDLSQNCFLFYTHCWLMFSWLYFDALCPTWICFHMSENVCMFCCFRYM